MLDEFEKAKGRADSIKRLIANRMTDYEIVREQFPEYFPPEDPFKDAKQDDGTYDIDKIDDTQVEWATPTTPEEDDEISRFIAEREGSFTGADFE